MRFEVSSRCCCRTLPHPKVGFLIPLPEQERFSSKIAPHFECYTHFTVSLYLKINISYYIKKVFSF